MSDCHSIIPCPECGAGNPLDSETCLNCSVNLLDAYSQFDDIRAVLGIREAPPRRSRRKRNSKPVGNLTIADLKRYPVWEFDLENEGCEDQDESWVKPVKRLPVTDLSNRVVGIPVKFACGTTVFALLGNIELQHLRKTQQFLEISLHIADDDWFSLGRYYHVDYHRHGPEALAQYVNLSLDEIFPITYDISAVARGIEAVVKGSIPLEPD